MREASIKQAREEISLVDSISSMLENSIRGNYKEINIGRGAIGSAGADAELVAGIHKIKVNLNKALEEIARRGYGKIVFVDEEDHTGRVIRKAVYRVSQANAGLPDAGIVARNSLIGSCISSCKVGEDFEIETPSGVKVFVVRALVTVEGLQQLLMPNADIKLARFYTDDDKVVDVIRDVRLFLNKIDEKTIQNDVRDNFGKNTGNLASAGDIILSESTSAVRRYIPIDWSATILSNDQNASLGAHFFTKTSKLQEDVIRSVRNAVVVNGVGGSGKTSIALGRLKFLTNFRSGENLGEYGLDPKDWIEFDSADMIGFVLNPSLVHYLRRTIDELELHMKVVDFEEFQNNERQSRRIFGRPYQRVSEESPPIQASIGWLSTLADVACRIIADALEKTLSEALPRPETPDGRQVSEARWREVQSGFWTRGPVRARLTGIIHGLRSKTSALSRLQGLAWALDQQMRLSDRETTVLSEYERRAAREAVLNLLLRLLRLLNPTELFVSVHQGDWLAGSLKDLYGPGDVAVEKALRATKDRVSKHLVTDGDVLTALCMNSVICDQFERDIQDIPYLRTYSDRIGVFIDEYQDFNEQQIFLMSQRARRKYRQITLSGDVGQRLRSEGVSRLADAIPHLGGSIREITLDVNFRQTTALADLSLRFRQFTEANAPESERLPCQAPLYVFSARSEFAHFAVNQIVAFPEAASVVVVCPNEVVQRSWFDFMRPGLEAAFRSPILSDRSRLTEKLKTHFATASDVKGLEFDVAVIPDVGEFSDMESTQLNGLYVAVSRPRHAVVMGCSKNSLSHVVVRRLLNTGDLNAITLE